MIDIRKLKELVRLMVENELSELDLQDQQETVTIKRGGHAPPVIHHAPVAMPYVAPGVGSAPIETDNGAPEPIAAGGGGAADTSGLVPITSPMVGTVYLSPNPEAPTFVGSGASVGPDTTICLIEAMKVFSEIKAEAAGTIERVLVTSGQAVQYGQQLFLIRPS